MRMTVYEKNENFLKCAVLKTFFTKFNCYLLFSLSYRVILFRSGLF